MSNLTIALSRMYVYHHLQAHTIVSDWSQMITIASERKRLGITQAQLAEHLGVSTSTVTRWERELLPPSANQLKDMHELFDCSIDYLVGISDNRKPLS